MKSELTRIKGRFNGDSQTFNNILQKAQPLINSLTHSTSINGFSSDIIRTFYEDKLIYVFNKYYQDPENIILAKVLNSLSLYKIRLLYKARLDTISMDDLKLSYFHNLADEDEDNRELFLNLGMSFIEKRLTEEAMAILQLKINPPQELINMIYPKKVISLNAIANYIIETYDEGEVTYQQIMAYLKAINKQITSVIKEAGEYFKDKDLELLEI